MGELTRRQLADTFRYGWRKPKADRSLAEYAAAGTPEYQAIVAESKRVPEEFFICRECGAGPWHITYGRCPNCTGA